MDVCEAIMAELAVSRRLVSAGVEVVPRFVITAPDGPHILIVQLPDDDPERLALLSFVRDFMVWKAASAFSMAIELIEPHAVSVIAVSRTDATGALQRISRNPLTFGTPEWFGRDGIDTEIIDLLPPKTVAITREELATIEATFLTSGVPGISWQHE